MDCYDELMIKIDKRTVNSIFQPNYYETDQFTEFFLYDFKFK